MTLLNLADIFSSLLGTENVYAGNIDSNTNKCVGVYNGRNSGAHRVAIGGEECTKTKEKNISILIHWTDNPSDTELNAYRISDVLNNARSCEYDGGVLKLMLLNDPVPIGRDDRGVCEYVIEGRAYFEETRKEDEK